MSEVYKVRVKGTRPLLMNSCRHMIEEKENKPSRGRKNLTPKEEAERFLYLDENGNLVVPSLTILACLRKSATNFKVPGRGKKTFKDFIYAGIRIEPENIPLITDDGWEPDLQPVVIGRARIIKSRPRINNWELNFEAEILDVIITPSTLKEILVDAGKYNGLLDFRPLYGLFEVVEFEKVK